MAAIHSDEFKRDAVRIALTSGLTRRQVASDLGVGLSTLRKWIRAISEGARVAERDADLGRENGRLRKENRILREERILPPQAFQLGVQIDRCLYSAHLHRAPEQAIASASIARCPDPPRSPVASDRWSAPSAPPHAETSEQSVPISHRIPSGSLFGAHHFSRASPE